jgi:hypothetical protein
MTVMNRLSKPVSATEMTKSLVTGEEVQLQIFDGNGNPSNGPKFRVTEVGLEDGSGKSFVFKGVSQHHGNVEGYFRVDGGQPGWLRFDRMPEYKQKAGHAVCLGCLHDIVLADMKDHVCKS